MDKERKDIPLWTWYNGQFLFQFDEQLRKNSNKSISEFFNDFLSSQEGLKELNVYQTKNQGTIILLLYGLMVIPREIWERDITRFPFNTRRSFVFKVPTDNNIDTLTFLRLFRNSLAHANFSLDVENKQWTFWNIQTNGTRNFEVDISHIELGLFTTEIGKYYINEVRKEQIESNDLS